MTTELSIGLDTLTDRLYVRSLKEKDLGDVQELYSDPQVMKLYHDGAQKSLSFIARRVDTWLKRWQEGDPWSAYAVFDRSENIFIGLVVMGHGDKPGESEMTCTFKPSAWNQGYGKELAQQVSFFVKLWKDYPIGGECVHTLRATAHEKNTASNILIKKYLGMPLKETKELYGAKRHVYELSVGDKAKEEKKS